LLHQGESKKLDELFAQVLEWRWNEKEKYRITIDPMMEDE